MQPEAFLHLDNAIAGFTLSKYVLVRCASIPDGAERAGDRRTF